MIKFATSIIVIKLKRPISCIKRYALFHYEKHPKEMGKIEIEAFLADLAVNRNTTPSIQNQAFNALLFLYEHEHLLHKIPELAKKFVIIYYSPLLAGI